MAAEQRGAPDAVLVTPEDKKIIDETHQLPNQSIAD